MDIYVKQNKNVNQRKLTMERVLLTEQRGFQSMSPVLINK